MSYTKDEIIVPRNVEDEIKESYLRYSMSVIISRALPDVRDGLKPSQRRILYAMRQLNLSPGGKAPKMREDLRRHLRGLPSARRDGHLSNPRPHGAGLGDALPPRSMDKETSARSTETPQLRCVIPKRGSRTLPWRSWKISTKTPSIMIPNYDETKTEPTVFPSEIPNLLCNGSSGIAVGMATNIPPHNLDELITATILVIDNPATTIDEIMEVMPAPDFPTGGVICGYRGIKEAYHTAAAS